MLQQELALAEVDFAYDNPSKHKVVLNVDKMLVLLTPPQSAARSLVLDEIGVFVFKIVDSKKSRIDFVAFIPEFAQLLDDLRQHTVADLVKPAPPLKAPSLN